MILARLIIVLVALTFCFAVDWSAGALAGQASGNINSLEVWPASRWRSSQWLSYLISPRNSQFSLFQSEDNFEPLVMPVIGVRPESLHDSFDAERSGGRIHNAIDIRAACGTPVLAAVPGKILKLDQNALGGTTVYQLGMDNRTVYYYAHLSRYSEVLVAGQIVPQGKMIAYVGDTGNAGAGNCHLHFAMWTVSDPKRFWHGDQINPYPLLRQIGN